MSKAKFDLSTETISSENVTIEVYRHAGGCLKSLKYHKNGKEFDILRSSIQPAVDKIEDFDARNTACYPLIPFSNRIGNAEFNYDGRTYMFKPNMPPEPHHIHGWAWQNISSIGEQHPNHVIIHHQQNNKNYPYLFSAEQDWTIRSDKKLGTTSVTVNLAIQNIGQRVMPFGLGLHPFFKRTPKTQIRAKSEKMLLNGKDKLPAFYIDVADGNSLSRMRNVNDLELDNCYTGWNRRCNVIWPEYKIEMLIEAKSAFSNLVVYIPKDEDFFCIEPVTNITDAHNNKLRISDTGLVDLAPSQVLSGSIRFQFKSFK